MTIKFKNMEEMNEYLRNGLFGNDDTNADCDTDINDAFIAVTSQAAVNDIPAFRMLNLND